jgi:hypothetical protein
MVWCISDRAFGILERIGHIFRWISDDNDNSCVETTALHVAISGLAEAVVTQRKHHEARCHLWCFFATSRSQELTLAETCTHFPVLRYKRDLHLDRAAVSTMRLSRNSPPVCSRSTVER